MWDVVLEKIKNQKIMRHLKPKPNQNGISSNNGGRIMNRLNSLNYTAHWNWILKCKDFIVLYILLKRVKGPGPLFLAVTIFKGRIMYLN